MIRASTKLDFAWGLALRMAASINAADPETMRMIGEIWTYAEFTRAAVVAAEAEAREWPGGPVDARGGAAACVARHAADLVAAGERDPAPDRLAQSSGRADRRRSSPIPDLRPLIDRYLPGAKGMAAEERIRIFRLAWDFAGSALASRNEQYERFYLASSPRNLARHLQFTDRSRADRLVRAVPGRGVSVGERRGGADERYRHQAAGGRARPRPSSRRSTR